MPLARPHQFGTLFGGTLLRAATFGAATLRSALLGSVLTGAVLQAHAGETFAPGESMVIESCAGGPTLSLRSNDRRALLDEPDRRTLQRAMRERFAVLERDGFAPVQILMWRKAPRELLYVSLAPSDDGSQLLCFTATFSAEVFEQTPALVRKYFFEGAATT